jgi:hypothetical protein
MLRAIIIHGTHMIVRYKVSTVVGAEWERRGVRKPFKLRQR